MQVTRSILRAGLNVKQGHCKGDGQVGRSINAGLVLVNRVFPRAVSSAVTLRSANPSWCNGALVPAHLVEDRQRRRALAVGPRPVEVHAEEVEFDQQQLLRDALAPLVPHARQLHHRRRQTIAHTKHKQLSQSLRLQINFQWLAEGNCWCVAEGRAHIACCQPAVIADELRVHGVPEHEDTDRSLLLHPLQRRWPHLPRTTYWVKSCPVATTAMQRPKTASMHAQRKRVLFLP